MSIILGPHDYQTGEEESEAELQRFLLANMDPVLRNNSKYGLFSFELFSQFQTFLIACN